MINWLNWLIEMNVCSSKWIFRQDVFEYIHPFISHCLSRSRSWRLSKVAQVSLFPAMSSSSSLEDLKAFSGQVTHHSSIFWSALWSPHSWTWLEYFPRVASKRSDAQTTSASFCQCEGAAVLPLMSEPGGVSLFTFFWKANTKCK